MQKTIQKIYDGKIQKGDMDADSWKANVELLWEAAQKGYGKTLAGIDLNDPDKNFLQQLQTNVYVFGAFKNHKMITDLVAALKDENDKLRTFSEFKKAAGSINDDYNHTWLKTEFNQAVGTAQSAATWQKQQANKHILPMLQYRTQRDGRVRASHRILDGITLPMDNDFWKKFYPPNGWGCRCFVIQTAGPEVQPTRLPDAAEVPPYFRFNPGIEGKIFDLSKSNPYVEAAYSQGKATVNDITNFAEKQQNNAS